MTDIRERCGACGFDYDLDAASGSATAIVDLAGDLARTLETSDADLRRRREPATWSPLEYACHVRDVLLVQRERVLLARRVEAPTLEPMGRDERVDHDGYSTQALGDVARQLRDAAALFANVLDRLDPPGWERTVIYNYPEARRRSLRWVAAHTHHELHHHLLDVRRQLVARATAARESERGHQ